MLLLLQNRYTPAQSVDHTIQGIKPSALIKAASLSFYKTSALLDFFVFFYYHSQSISGNSAVG